MAKAQIKQNIKPETFPTWLFHKAHGGVIFNSQKDVQEAGDGWHFSPADVQPKEPVHKFEKPLSSMTFIELIVSCRSLGLAESSFQGKTKDEIIVLLNERE